jgi:hypothetical protein
VSESSQQLELEVKNGEQAELNDSNVSDSSELKIKNARQEKLNDSNVSETSQLEIKNGEEEQMTNSHSRSQLYIPANPDSLRLTYSPTICEYEMEAAKNETLHQQSIIIEDLKLQVGIQFECVYLTNYFSC